MLFADEIVFCSTNRQELEIKGENWRKALEDRGLKISRGKTEYLAFYQQGDGTVKMAGETLNRAEAFKYLRSIVSDDGGLGQEIIHRVKAGWMNWKKMSGVLCDKRISLKAKGRLYKSVVRPALMYGAEQVHCWVTDTTSSISEEKESS